MNTVARHPTDLFSTLVSAVAKRPLLSLLLAAVFIATTSLFWPVLQWFVLKMSMANGWLHILAFAGLCGIGLYRISRLDDLPLHTPHFALWPTLLWISSGLLYLLNEAQVGFNTLSAALFILFVYGLSGYFIRQHLWRSLFIPTSLLILVLPFEHYLDVYLGFPLRLLSAQWAASVLQHTGLSLLTVESVLMIDNRSAIVDLDCSGIKSLWIGLIFYLLLTWIERYRINGHWLLIGLFYLLLLVLANVARITILVLLELVLDMPALAGLLHQTLGLLGFGIASALVWWAMPYLHSRISQPCPHRKGVSKDKSPPSPQSTVYKTKRSNQRGVPSSRNKSLSKDLPLRKRGNEGDLNLLQHLIKKSELRNEHLLTTLTLCLILTMNLLYQPQAAIAHTSTINKLNLPKQYALTTTQLNPQEQRFFTSNQSQADKYQLDLNIDGEAVRVAMVLVWSRAWKTHHVPENCYLSQGFSIDAQSAWQLPTHTLRHLQLRQTQAGKPSGTPRTALYWFQSATSSTPDYSARVMDNLFHPKRNWAMVSLLFERPVTPQQISPFIQTLKHAIEDQFDEN